MPHVLFDILTKKLNKRVQGMHEENLIIWIYCFVDDFLNSAINTKIRARGKIPKLSDAEALTIEISSEFLGLDENTCI